MLISYTARWCYLYIKEWDLCRCMTWRMEEGDYSTGPKNALFWAGNYISAVTKYVVLKIASLFSCLYNLQTTIGDSVRAVVIKRENFLWTNVVCLLKFIVNAGKRLYGEKLLFHLCINDHNNAALSKCQRKQRSCTGRGLSRVLFFMQLELIWFILSAISKSVPYWISRFLLLFMERADFSNEQYEPALGEEIK